jgi:hypothetical protein
MAALLRDAGVVADLRARGELVASAARAAAPVKSGAFRAGITVWVAQTDRVVVGVGSTVDHAAVVEAKSGTMSRALDAAGGAA